MVNQAEELKSEIQGFLSENVSQDFKFTKENVDKIDIINAMIQSFFSDPFKFIDINLSLSAEMMEIRIAEIQAQIEDYREFIKWQNPQENIKDVEATIKKLNTDLKGLEEIKWEKGILKGISKATKQRFSGDLDAEKQFILEEIKLQNKTLVYYQIEHEVFKDPSLALLKYKGRPNHYVNNDNQIYYQKALKKFYNDPDKDDSEVELLAQEQQKTKIFQIPLMPDILKTSPSERMEIYTNYKSTNDSGNDEKLALDKPKGKSVKGNEKAGLIYSSPLNPIKKVTYHAENNNSEQLELTQFREGKAYYLTTEKNDNPKYTTVIEYAKGRLIMYPNGTVGLPPVPNLTELTQNPQWDPSFSEDEFVNNIIYQFEKSQVANKCINLESMQLYDKENPDAARARILSKLVHRYCINENGEVDEDKYNEIRTGILLGNSLRQWREIFLKPELYFLRGPKNISPQYWLNLMGFKAIKRSGGHTEYLHSKQAQEQERIKKFIEQQNTSELAKPSNLTQYNPVTSKFIKDKLQEQKAAQQKKGFFPTAWVPTFKTKVSENSQFEKALQKVIAASAEDYNKAFPKETKDEILTPEQEKLKEAIKTIEKILKFEEKDLRPFLDGKRQERLDEKYKKPTI